MERIAIDELNNMSEESMRSMPYEDYFGEMDLTDDEKQKRIELAEKFEKSFLFILLLIAIEKEYGSIQWQNIQQQVSDKYREALQDLIDVDDYVNDYIDQFSADIVKSTKENTDEPYTLSYDRARYISENESNAMYNHQDLQDAIKAGKTKKTWVTMHDRRVRKTHSEADGQTVGINEPFVVGDSLMLVPKDSETYGASSKECINCRCTVKYY